jgi:hypothetical protein
VNSMTGSKSVHLDGGDRWLIHDRDPTLPQGICHSTATAYHNVAQASCGRARESRWPRISSSTPPHASQQVPPHNALPAPPATRTHAPSAIQRSR